MRDAHQDVAQPQFGHLLLGRLNAGHIEEPFTTIRRVNAHDRRDESHLKEGGAPPVRVTGGALSATGETPWLGTCCHRYKELDEISAW
jgi:hypothetical protein